MDILNDKDETIGIEIQCGALNKEKSAVVNIQQRKGKGVDKNDAANYINSKGVFRPWNYHGRDAPFYIAKFM